MAAGALGLSPVLRPWSENGVEFLLADAPLPAPYSLCLEAAAAPQVRPQAPRRQGEPQAGVQIGAPGSPSFDSGTRRETPPVRRPFREAGAMPPGETPRPSAPPSPPASSAAPPEVSSSPLSILPPDHWPAVWRQRLSATRPAVVLWTYWALGEDLCLRPNAARRDLFRRLLGELGHPAGTHSFWPAALPGERGLEADCQVFWSGVDILKARALVVMGSPAVKALELPTRLRPFQQTRHNGRMVVVLRDVDFLVEETHRYDAVREFLRQALAPFARVSD